MSSTAARYADPSPRPAAAPPASPPGVADPLDGDRIDYDAWLLPPAAPGPGERAVRAASVAAGPIALAAAVAGLLALR